jgi:hypothetical protein
MVGAWTGQVNTPWTPPYQVEFVMWNDMVYSCHKLSYYPSCFYYGHDYESPQKTINLIDIKTNGETWGEIEIYWSYPSSGSTTRGSLEHLVLSDNNTQLRFEFWSTWGSGRYGPIVFRLTRTMDVPPQMCADYCDNRGICNFTDSQCRATWTSSSTTGIPNIPIPIPVPPIAMSSADRHEKSSDTVAVVLIVVFLVVTVSVVVVIWIAVRRRRRNSVLRLNDSSHQQLLSQTPFPSTTPSFTSASVPLQSAPSSMPFMYLTSPVVQEPPRTMQVWIRKDTDKPGREVRITLPMDAVISDLFAEALNKLQFPQGTKEGSLGVRDFNGAIISNQIPLWSLQLQPLDVILIGVKTSV